MIKKIMKRIIIALVLLTTMTAASAQIRNLRFGYLSYGEVMKVMPQYVKAQKELETLRQTYAKELERSEQAFNRQYEEYIDGQMTFPENILMKRQKELQVLMEQSISFKQESQRLLKEAEAELMAPVRQHLEYVLAEIGTQRGYPYILNTDSNACPFINPEMADDITEEVKVAVAAGK